MQNKKGNAVVIVLVIVVLAVAVLGFLGRHQIKSMLGLNSATPVSVTVDNTSPVASPAAVTPSDNIYLTKNDAAKGNYMTDFNGMTLYTFDKDPGVSTCTGSCLQTWPAYTSGATAQSTFPTGITVIIRPDSTKQFAWKNMPLYYYSGDTKAGDLNGDGVGGVWHIVKL